jgi:hypothetical protein
MKVKFLSNWNQYELNVYRADNPFRFQAEETTVVLKDVIVFPGLINAHDHLDFNLFPFLKNRLYKDYKDWSSDIHTQNEDEIRSVLRIPRHLRIEWGIIKNLLSGVTTVVHHGHLPHGNNQPSSIFLNYQYLHAIGTERFWKLKLNFPIRKDIIIHVGEGVTSEAHSEINHLLRWNFLRRSLIAVHGIAMDEQQSKKFKAIVWCPDSNIRLYGQTAKVDVLKKNTKVLFGTDSALSASANIWDQLRTARALHLMSDQEIFNMMVKTPLEVFPRLSNSGMVVARNKGTGALDSFFALQPEDILMVFSGDTIVLADRSTMDLPSRDYAFVIVNKSLKLIPRRLAEVVNDLEKWINPLPLNVTSTK